MQLFPFYCNKLPFLLQCKYLVIGLWTEWSNCYNECGDEAGTRYRSRICNDNQKCGEEKLHESQPCPAQCNENTCKSVKIS